MEKGQKVCFPIHPDLAIIWGRTYFEFDGFIGYVSYLFGFHEEEPALSQITETFDLLYPKLFDLFPHNNSKLAVDPLCFSSSFVWDTNRNWLGVHQKMAEGLMSRDIMCLGIKSSAFLRVLVLNKLSGFVCQLS